VGDYADLNRQYWLGLVLIFLICLPLDFLFPLYGIITATVLIGTHLTVHITRCSRRKKGTSK